MSLFKMWEEHYISGKLPPEWSIWEECRTWAINNRYKAEYGYKGEFSPKGCLKAMPGYKGPEAPIVGIDLANGPDTAIYPDGKIETSQKEGGTKNASKKTNTRSRSRDSV